MQQVPGVKTRPAYIWARLYEVRYIVFFVDYHSVCLCYSLLEMARYGVVLALAWILHPTFLLLNRNPYSVNVSPYRNVLSSQASK